MISSELPEILGMSDRIAVMHAGTIRGVLDRGEATQDDHGARAGAGTDGRRLAMTGSHDGKRRSADRDRRRWRVVARGRSRPAFFAPRQSDRSVSGEHAGAASSRSA